MFFNRLNPLSPNVLVMVVALFLLLTGNGAFFKHVADTYGTSPSALAMIGTIGIVVWAANVILLSIFSFRYTIKPFLILVLVVSSQVAYFMDSYDVVIDTHMLQNAIETNVAESRDLLSWKQLGYLIVFGLLPSFIIYRLPIMNLGFKHTWISKVKTIGLALGIALVIIAGFSKFYTSFFREHKPLRYYANPSYYFYSVGKYVSSTMSYQEAGLKVIGQDACINAPEQPRKLMILVVGEAVRWDHFGLNGYSRDTTPLLRKENVFNFTDISSCGTETAVSVPCMFSILGRSDFDKDKAAHTENILDVLSRAGVNVLWRDNNSDSKGVASRLAYEDFKTPQNNTVCDEECRDEGMLVGLDRYIKEHPKGDILIVLHQMGNHGPAYYKRYPKSYQRFSPVCQTNQLEQCSQKEIINAYDNTILYTDTFLSKTINFLKGYNCDFQTAMVYLSDHGESLGENGLYLHGFPYAIAPEAQKHVPMVMWFGDRFSIDKNGLAKRVTQPYSQDYLFHTLLNLMDVNTSAYQSDLDMLHGLR